MAETVGSPAWEQRSYVPCILPLHALNHLYVWVSEMALWGKVLTAKPDSLSLISTTHIAGEENHLPQIAL